ncbi:hypothetical protein AGMMS49921_11440 [Endomicrobiia bacterium]|nr:hypothetical protein AGMMS49921_11440 [Endomicrobiia bacterium]
MIAKDGGCSWDKSKLAESGLCSAYTAPCPVKLSKTNITLCSKEAIEKEIKYTLIRSLQGFDGLCKKFTPPPLNKGPVVYKWNLEIVDSKDLLTSSSNSSKESGGGLSKDLVATLAQKTIALEAVALCIGH